jgi:predicted ATPase/class 3 adenylate cyclase
MPDTPSATVTFLFTDIEGSTHLWERHPEAMKLALARHDELVRGAIEGRGGRVFKALGDAFCAAFAVAGDALAAAVLAQRNLEREPWGATGLLKVRMALHSGAAEERGRDYFGPPLNRTARLLAAGHGRQILLSAAAQELTRDGLAEGLSLRDLGEHRLRDLARAERIFQVVDAERPCDFPALRTLDERPNNLPMQPTALVGRERELAAARGMLLSTGVRLVTLTGPGGAGKTRVALQTAADLIDSFEDGVFLVPLAAVRDAEHLSAAIAEVLGISEASDRTTARRLREAVGARAMLLVLDNFEQVVTASPAVAELLAGCPGLKVLATSREPLHLRGEKELAVPPLSLPDPRALPALEAMGQYEAVALFIQRAVDVQPGFAVSNENAPAVAEICHRLDGLPLAIELAAARVKHFTPQAMLPRLASGLKLLTGGARDLPARQQTIRSAIAWSHDLLDGEERRLFRCLSVFAGGFTLEAAEAVCGADVADGVSSLADKSLLKREEREGDGRHSMLGTIREYGLERLAEAGEREEMAGRCARHFLALVEEADRRFRGPEQPRWSRRLEAELENLRFAFAYFREAGRKEDAIRLCKGVGSYWIGAGRFTELQGWTEQALALEGATSEALRAWGMAWLGYTAAWIGDRERGWRLLTEATGLGRAVGDRRFLAWILEAMGCVPARTTPQGLPLATACLEESIGLYRELEDWAGVGRSLQDLGNCAMIGGDLAHAKELFEEALPLCRRGGVPRDIGMLTMDLADLALRTGDLKGARTTGAECLRVVAGISDLTGLGLAFMQMSRVAQAEGRPVRTACLLGALAGIARRVDFPMPKEYSDELEAAKLSLRAAMGDEAFAAAFAKGRAMSMDEAVSFALEARDEAAPG